MNCNRLVSVVAFALIVGAVAQRRHVTATRVIVRRITVGLQSVGP